MSMVEAKEFLIKIMSDTELTKKFAAAGNDSESLEALIKGEGFDCTTEELLEACNQLDNNFN